MKTIDNKINNLKNQAQILNEEAKRMEEYVPTFFKNSKVDIQSLYNYFNSIKRHNTALNKLQKSGFNIISALIVEWLKSRPVINVLAVEKLINIPAGTISNVISSKNGRNIPPKYLPHLIKLLKEYGL